MAERTTKYFQKCDFCHIELDKNYFDVAVKRLKG